jgi:uncharacterized pyridoxamine 5'-phosphate oxidase family protein
MTWEKALQIGQEAVLSTSSKSGKPHAIVVIIKGVVEDKVLLNVCQMKTSLKNLKENNRVCLSIKKSNEYYRIEGKGTLHSSGKYFDLAVKRNTPGTPTPNYALTIKIESVYDVDKVKKLL